MGGASRRRVVAIGAIEPVLAGSSRSSRRCARRCRCRAGKLLRGAPRHSCVASRRMPRQARKPCSGCGLARMMASTRAIGGGTDLAGLAHHPGRCPLGVTPMALGMCSGIVVWRCASVRADMARDARALVEASRPCVSVMRASSYLADEARAARSSNGRAIST